jgi:voltage-gated potassium channel
VPNYGSMYERLERRLTDALTSLTLRKAVALIVAVATILAFAAAVLERLIDPAFDTFGQALWFSVSTVTTVGYGDYVPESTAGRFVATALMLTGLGLIPLITSVVVSILVAQRSRDAREQELRDLHEVLDRLDAVDQRIAGLESRPR